MWLVLAVVVAAAYGAYKVLTLKPAAYRYSKNVFSVTVDANSMDFRWLLDIFMLGPRGIGSSTRPSDLYFVQELQLTESVFQHGVEIVHQNLQRKELFISVGGVISDHHQHPSMMLTTVQGDHYKYNVTATMYRVENVQGQGSGGGASAPGIISQQVSTQFPGQPPLAQSGTAQQLTYDQKENVAAYEYTWEMERTPAGQRNGYFKYAFSRPDQDKARYEGHDPQSPWPKI